MGRVDGWNAYLGIFLPLPFPDSTEPQPVESLSLALDFEPFHKSHLLAAVSLRCCARLEVPGSEVGGWQTCGREMRTCFADSLCS